MEQSRVFSQMLNAESYPHPVQNIIQMQTHISSVFLTGDYVYKIKKAVDFGFLDFSTLEKRKHFCKEELRLNRRLSPDLYLDIVPITVDEYDIIQVDGQGRIVEYAVKMKQFPQSHIMSHRLQKNRVSYHHLDQIITILIDFYNRQDPTDEILSFGEKNAIYQNISENFQQTQSFIGTTIDQHQFDRIQSLNQEFFSSADILFDQRIENKMIKPCHGDLHSGNIVIRDDTIHIFDCIEFNKRFRYIDVASDLGFLAMDLDVRGKPFLSSYLIHEYLKKTKDVSFLDILNFYKSYRAYVRGKVEGFKLNDSGIPSHEKAHIIDTAHRYFQLSEYYITLCHIVMRSSHPFLFLISGLTGTGKSTLSDKLSIDYQAQVINTDVIRKTTEGIDMFEPRHDQPDTGLYAQHKRERTYQQVLDYASDLLKENRNVILDATFQKKSHREAVRNLALIHHAPLVMIQCTSPDEVVKKWLDQRVKTKSVSDGRWEIYQIQKQSFEPFDEDENAIVLDMSNEDFHIFFDKLIQIQQTILKQVE